jgi:DnaJ-class molecular chaperone
MSGEFEIDSEATCPKCQHEGVHYRDCTNFCEDGFHDESDDDPINFMPGESLEKCAECKGTGVEVWCPKCGANLSGIKLHEDEDDQDPDYAREEFGEWPNDDIA